MTEILSDCPPDCEKLGHDWVRDGQIARCAHCDFVRMPRGDEREIDLESPLPEPKIIAECRPVGEIGVMEAELTRLRKENAARYQAGYSDGYCQAEFDLEAMGEEAFLLAARAAPLAGHDEISRLRAENAELREALGFIARQKKAAEITSADLPEEGMDASELDWEGGFDACVDCARDALASVESPEKADG